MHDPIHHSLLTALAALRQRKRARQETAQFLRDAFRLLYFNKIDGDFAEFGCPDFHVHGLAWQAIREQPFQRQLWAIGGFDRIPEAQTAIDLHPRWLADTPLISEAAFKRRCRWAGLPPHRSHVIKVDAMAKPQTPAGPDNIALAWINCQPHCTINAVLLGLEEQLKHGMILVFEHYDCWSRFERSGARNALLNLQQRRPDLSFIQHQRFGRAAVSWIIEDA